jgi:hypothetical protein
MMAEFDERTRRLVLACEIAGYLHDLGKLHPGFADEKLEGGKAWDEKGRAATGISEPHGRILEDGRVYPHAGEIADKPALGTVLAAMRADPAWAAALALPAEWVKPGTVQAPGLGAALRQHHAGSKFPADELSFLGDLYTFGADIRDSALDKGSGGADGGKQGAALAEIADAFGQHRSHYSSEWLVAHWQEAIAALSEILSAATATDDMVATRRSVLDRLAPIFENALGETRRPTNDVALRHHAHSTASFFKAAVAEGMLRGDFKPWQDDKGLFDVAKLGRVRFRLLGIRWDWAALTRGMLSPVALVSLSGRRRDVVDNLRELFEEQAAIGNLIYEDDDGVLILAPGFFEDDAARSEAGFAGHVLDPLADRIAAAIAPLGAGTPFRLCWTEPTLYLTDYREALGLDKAGPRQRHLQADEAKLRALWDAANAAQHKLMQICPQCGLRPAETREYALTESAVRAQTLCDDCAEFSDRDAKRARARHLAAEFGFRTSSFNLEDLAKDAGSSRVALLSVQVDAGAIASGAALVTQLARPVGSLMAAKDSRIISANALGDWFEQVLADLLAGKSIDDQRAEIARKLLGDAYWLKKSDGRGEPQEVATGFFLRESANLPLDWGLARHDGDRLALFAMRKHASPARLQRLWDDLRGLWKALANELADELGGGVLPLTLDARGLRFAVAATDADAAVTRINEVLSQRFAKIRGGFAAHVSCVVTRPKFPLYLALDALERMERRVPDLPHQRWTVESAQPSRDGSGALVTWTTPQGLVRWNVNLATHDPQQADRWHPHVMAVRRKGAEVTGPDRITHVSDLLPGDAALILPMTFDFIALEGSARRHQIAWRREADELRRPHWVMGEAGRPPLLLEGFGEFSRLLSDTGWDIGKAKRLQGEMIETYEKWVRDVPAALRETGRSAWHAHLRNMLLRYAKGNAAQREQLFNAITDGRFFDAVEWSTFVSKPARQSSVSEATA